MTTRAPMAPAAGAPPGERSAPWSAAAILALALALVLLQVSVMPYLRLAEGIPDLVAPLVVMVAMLRGTLVGAVTGFGAGLTVELTAPIGTVGALALLYLAVGAFAGRYCERRESYTLLAPLALAVAAAGVVQLGYALLQLLLGQVIPASELVGRVLIPTLLLTALLCAPVLLAVRRLLGTARTMEPYAGPR